MTENEAYEMLDSMLDQAGPVTIAGLEFDPSRILRECDPIAYRCMFFDYMDAQGIDTDDLV
jgi:hypothetical protein